MLVFSISIFITSICFGLCCAVVGMAYTCIMVEPDGLLDFWKDYLHKKLERHGMFSYIEPANNFQHKLFKVLVDCTACFSGQLCFWIFFLFKDYNLVQHIFSVAFAIVFGKILNTLYIKLNHAESNG